MSLINARYGAEPVRTYAVQAGDAAEMVSRLTAAAAAAVAAGADDMSDFKLAGSGIGPLWEAWFVAGEGTISINVEFSAVHFLAAVAGNPTEATLLLNQQIDAAAAAITPPDGLVMYKIEVAGAGAGPNYMAVAMYAIEPPPG